MLSTKTKKKLLIIFFVALVLRMGFYLCFANYDNYSGLTWDYINDSSSLLSWSHVFMTQSRFGNGYVLNTIHPKGYAVLIAIMRLILSDYYWFGVIFVQCLLDSIVCILLYQIAVKLFSNSRIGMACSVIWSVFPFAIVNCTQQLPDAFSCFLVALLIWAYFKEYKTRWIRYIAIGVICGVAQYFRSEFMYLWVLVILADIIRRVKWKTVFLGVATLCITIIGFDSPWIIYSYKMTGTPLLSTTNAWSAAYGAIGENPDNSIGASKGDLWLEEIAVSKGYEGAFCIEANNYFKGQFIDYVSQYPGEYIYTIVKYRLYDAFVPTSYIIFGLNRSGEQNINSTLMQKMIGSDHHGTAFNILSTLDQAVKRFEGQCRYLSWILLICMIIFIIVNRKKWRDYTLLYLIWLFFPLAISALKQVEPRNVAGYYPVLILAFGYCVISLFGKLKQLLVRKDTQTS